MRSSILDSLSLVLLEYFKSRFQDSAQKVIDMRLTRIEVDDSNAALYIEIDPIHSRNALKRLS